MWIEHDNVRAWLGPHRPAERRWLRRYLKLARRGAYEDDERMFDELNAEFPAGFVGLVAQAGRREGFEVELLDRRVRPCEPHDADLGWLYEHQLEAVEAGVKKVRGIWHVPTGGGKTESAVGIVLRVPCRWLFLVHRANLMEQAADRFERRTGDRTGRIGEGGWRDVDERFVCATFQTVYAGLKKGDQRAVRLVERAESVIFDEHHVVPARTYWQVAMATVNAYWRIGMSGTPLARGDRMGVLGIAATGKVIYRVRADELIRRGLLARPVIKMMRLEQECTLPTWQGVYGRCVSRSAPRNALLARMCLRASKPCLLFVKELRHGREMVKRLGKAGLRAEFTHGKHSASWQKTLVRSLERGAIDVLVTTVVLQEGVDIPSLRSIVVGSGGKSTIAALQRLGRGTRTDQGRKATFELYDVADRGNRWMVRHTRDRKRAYISEGFEVVEEA